MNETTLFLGPDPEIMRHHAIAKRTSLEEQVLSKGSDPLLYDRIRRRLGGSLDEAFEMCESMGQLRGLSGRICLWRFIRLVEMCATCLIVA